MGEYVRVARLSDLREKRGSVVEFPDKNVEIALFRDGDTCRAISNICPHEHTPGLADGPVSNGFVTCPMHGWQFSLKTGNTLNGAKGVKTFRVRIDGDDVYVEEPSEERPAWSL